jgi:hypothetical protein
MDDGLGPAEVPAPSPAGVATAAGAEQPVGPSVTEKEVAAGSPSSRSRPVPPLSGRPSL